MASQYVKSAVDGGTSFEVSPAAAPIPFVELAVACAVAAFVFSISATAGLIVGAAFLAFVVFTMWLSPSATKHRSGAAFVAGPAGVSIGGKTIPKDAIHRLIIRNHVSGAESSSTVFIGGNAASQAMAGISMAGMEAKQRRLRKLAEVSYRLDAEAGGHATVLAGGLDETTAFGLMKDVGASIQI